jgi:hypothetical protein
MLTQLEMPVTLNNILRPKEELAYYFWSVLMNIGFIVNRKLYTISYVNEHSTPYTVLLRKLYNIFQRLKYDEVVSFS